MYEAFKAAGGHIRLWLYQGLKHDCWTRAYGEPELPRWLLEHRLEPEPARPSPAYQEPSRPPSPSGSSFPSTRPPSGLPRRRLTTWPANILNPTASPRLTIFVARRPALRTKTATDNSSELAAESPTELFYPYGSSITRLIAQRDSEGRVIAIVFRDDRHEERWEKRNTACLRSSLPDHPNGNHGTPQFS